MSIEIINNNTTLTIKVGTAVRTINKALVREVVVLRNSILKIDIGGGALRNIFLPIADMVAPTFKDNEELVSLVNVMLEPAEVAITHNLTDLARTIGDMQSKLGTMMPATLQQPILVDESNPKVIYSGFAELGSDPNAPVWAIMRTSLIDEVQTNQWVNGSQNTESIWTDRESLTFA